MYEDGSAYLIMLVAINGIIALIFKKEDF